MHKSQSHEINRNHINIKFNSNIITATTYTTGAFNNALARQTTPFDIPESLSKSTEKLTTYTMSETNKLINGSFRTGVLSLYKDDAPERKFYHEQQYILQ